MRERMIASFTLRRARLCIRAQYMSAFRGLSVLASRARSALRTRYRPTAPFRPGAVPFAARPPISVSLTDTVSEQGKQAIDPHVSTESCLACGATLPSRASHRGFDRLLGSPGEFEVRTCGACGAGCTAPPLSTDELADFYRDGYASHEEATSSLVASVVGALKRAQVAAILRAAPFSAVVAGGPGRALDIGCGRGDLAAALVARGWQVAGVEPSELAGAIASRRGVHLVGPTLQAATLAEGQYDLVVLRHSLEHLPNPLGDLRRVRDALRPGGQVVISVPNFASWQRERFGASWFHLDLPRHRVHFTPSSLTTILHTVGLTVQSKSTSTSAIGLPASVQYALVHRCLAPRGAWFRASAAACCAVFPLTWLIDRVGGELDTLHFVAQRA
jgi:SAM-dependent methyltransferase